MSLLSGFSVDFDTTSLMGYASLAAFDGKPIPEGWTVVTPEVLGLGAQYQDGNYFKNGSSGASAIVLEKDGQYIISFRGTDGDNDVARYPTLANGSYLNLFTPLLNAVIADAPVDAHFSFTGASLGGGVVNNIANVAATAFGGRFADATFVAFASPLIVNKSGILNLGFENDPVYKLVNGYKDQPSSLDHIVLATDSYLAGNYNGRTPFDMNAHNSAQDGLDAVMRLQTSEFYDLMNPDSVVILAASDGVIQDHSPKRASVGAFYVGRDAVDQIAGRNGADYIESFGGNDIVSGGAGNDWIKAGDGDDTITGGAGSDKLEGGAGNDIFVVSGAEATLDQISGGDGTDTLKVIGTSDLTLGTFNAGTSSLEVWQGNGKGVIGDKAANTIDLSALTSVSGLAYVDGGAGNDVLVGSQFDDVLRGNKGLDQITGGAGNDVLTGGGKEADTFIFHAGFGKDTITDFTAGVGVNDIIQFDTSMFANFGAVIAASVQVGANVEIHLNDADILTLNNVTIGKLAADDFRFIVDV